MWVDFARGYREHRRSKVETPSLRAKCLRAPPVCVTPTGSLIFRSGHEVGGAVGCPRSPHLAAPSHYHSPKFSRPRRAEGRRRRADACGEQDGSGVGRRASCLGVLTYLDRRPSATIAVRPPVSGGRGPRLSMERIDDAPQQAQAAQETRARHQRHLSRRASAAQQLSLDGRGRRPDDRHARNARDFAGPGSRLVAGGRVAFASGCPDSRGHGPAALDGIRARRPFRTSQRPIWPDDAISGGLGRAQRADERGGPVLHDAARIPGVRPGFGR
jgi:hypothetical protein